jgi:hypothetical protein
VSPQAALQHDWHQFTNSALAKLENLDSKVEPDLTTLTVFKPADLICHLWQRYTSTAIIPLAGSNVAIRREMGTFNAHNVVRMEGKINAVIQKALDSELASAVSRMKACRADLQSS